MYDTKNLKPDLERTLQNSIKNPPVSIGLDAIRQAYSDKIWVVGGYINTMAASLIDNKKRVPKDVDLLLKYKVDFDKIPTPQNWYRTSSGAGALKFKKGDDMIDIWSLADIPRFLERNMKMTLRNYLNTVPLTIQSIAYDIDNKKIYGDIGMCSIKLQSVGVNDMVTLEAHAIRKGISISDYIGNKANSLGFTALIPSDDVDCAFSSP